MGGGEICEDGGAVDGEFGFRGFGEGEVVGGVEKEDAGVGGVAL